MASWRSDDMNKMVVQIDPELSDLIPGFLANKRNDMRRILAATTGATTDFEALSRIGHKLKGEGGSYGLEAISIYGGHIEQAANARDAAAVRRFASELSAYLDSVQVVYE
jgi:HPt (histidine-containing phosphotransfer) domain-containing protein